MSNEQPLFLAKLSENNFQMKIIIRAIKIAKYCIDLLM